MSSVSRVENGSQYLLTSTEAMKIVGAAAARKYAFQRCVDLGRAINDQVVSIGSALDHCHVPGRQKHETISKDVVVVGAGKEFHNLIPYHLCSLLRSRCTLHIFRIFTHKQSTRDIF
jgi:hypothetical protein